MTALHRKDVAWMSGESEAKDQLRYYWACELSQEIKFGKHRMIMWFLSLVLSIWQSQNCWRFELKFDSKNSFVLCCTIKLELLLSAHLLLLGSKTSNMLFLSEKWHEKHEFTPCMMVLLPLSMRWKSRTEWEKDMRHNQFYLPWRSYYTYNEAEPFQF